MTLTPWRWLLAVALAVGLLSSGPALAADKASDFTLRDINGQEVTLSSFQGKVVLISFWATWCAPCKAEMVHLHEMYQAKKDQGFEVLSISTDDARTASQVKPYIKKQGYTFPVLLDKESTVVGTYNPQKTLPYTVIVNREGQVAHIAQGYNPGDEVGIEAIVAELLGGGETATETEAAATESTATEG